MAGVFFATFCETVARSPSVGSITPATLAVISSCTVKISRFRSTLGPSLGYPDMPVESLDVLRYNNIDRDQVVIAPCSGPATARS